MDHKKGIYYRAIPKEMILNGYMIQDSNIVVGGKEVRYEKLIEILNTAKDKGVEKIIMSSTKRIIGTTEELQDVAEAFKKCGVTIETNDGKYENGEFTPNLFAESTTMSGINMTEIINRETWENVQNKIGDTSDKTQDESKTLNMN